MKTPFLFCYDTFSGPSKEIIQSRYPIIEPGIENERDREKYLYLKISSWKHILFAFFLAVAIDESKHLFFEESLSLIMTEKEHLPVVFYFSLL